MPKPNPENLALFQIGQKRCCKCREIKKLEDFTKCEMRLNGYNPRCKECDQKYQQENSVKYKLTSLHYREQRRQYLRDKEKKRIQTIGEEAFYAHRKKLYQLNKEKHRLKRIEQMKDPLFRVSKQLRDRLYHAIKKIGINKKTHTKELLGCSFEEAKLHIESLWLPGMDWSNYGHGKGKWCIDHIIPCAMFDLTKLEDQQKCFHYTNLQPLWYSDNAKKSSIYEGKKHYYHKDSMAL